MRLHACTTAGSVASHLISCRGLDASGAELLGPLGLVKPGQAFSSSFKPFQALSSLQPPLLTPNTHGILTLASEEIPPIAKRALTLLHAKKLATTHITTT